MSNYYMKQYTIRRFKVSFIIILSFLMLLSCTTDLSSDDSRVIIQEFGYITPSMSTQIADVNNLEAVTELSSHIVQCKVLSRDGIEITDAGIFSFEYSVEIVDILLDVNDTLRIGDVIPVTSSEGILRASEAADLIKDTPRAQKLGILQGDYNDNEYIISSTWDAIPIEVGKTYIMFVTDRYLEAEGVYSESGRSFLYEISEQTVFNSRKMSMNDMTAIDIINEILAQIELRTGRVEEVGATQYMMELGEKQAQMIADSENIN